MEPHPDALQAWAAIAIARAWPGTRIDGIAAIRGDASERRFWRLRLAPAAGAPATAILVDLGPHDLPAYARILKLVPEPVAEPPWINVHRFLISIGVPVPALYDYAREHRALLVEDIGDLSLSDAARRPGADAGDLFRLAVDELLRIHIEGTRHIDRKCIAESVNYDGRLFEWELKEFVEICPALISPAANAAAIKPELAMLAAQLDAFPRVFSHRDYHARNLFIQESKRPGAPHLRVIDFQDALMAPAAQDLAVLMTTRDAGEIITPAIERRLLDFYWTSLERRHAGALSMNDFIASYRLCVLQHALKVTGRFEAFERAGKTGYREYIPHAIAQARRMLVALDREFPILRVAMGA